MRHVSVHTIQSTVFYVCGTFWALRVLLQKLQTQHGIPWLFEPVYRPQIWGGDAFHRILNRDVPRTQRLGESWEVYRDSQVSFLGSQGGQYALSELWHLDSSDAHSSSNSEQPFPWMIKWLDCAEPLSVQVHPGDELARKIDQDHRGKSEVWVVREARPDARLYLGWQAGVTLQDIEQVVLKGLDPTDLMQTFTPRKHDVISIPAGTVHSLSGALVAEFQQPSDTTYRLYDWNRVDASGMPRALHIAPAMASLDLESNGSIVAQMSGGLADREDLDMPVFASDWIQLRRYSFQQELAISTEGRMSAWVVFEGGVELSPWNADVSQMLTQGQTLLVPRACPGMTWKSVDSRSPCTLLRADWP